MPNIRWLSIEIGYESPEPDTCAGKPDLQKELEKLLPRVSLYDWALGGTEMIPDVTTDAWVAHFLQTRINAALATHQLENGGGTSDSLALSEDDVCGYRAKEFKLLQDERTGSPDTRCKLRGKIWVNSRSYLLRKSNGAMWLEDVVPVDAIVFATLTWECHPVCGD